MAYTALLFILIYMAGIGAALFLDGIWAFYLYQLVYFIYPEDRWWAQDLPGIRYSLILVAILLVAFIVRYSNYRDNRLFEAPQTKWLIMLLVMFCATYFVALDPLYHKQALTEVAKLLVMMALGYKLVDSPKKLDCALWAYIVGAAYIGQLARHAGRDGFGRVEGVGTVTTDDANGVAAMLAPTVAILMFYAWRGKMISKVLAVLLGAFIVNGIVLFNSRGAFLAVVVGGSYFVVSMITSRFQQANQKATAIVLIIASLGGGLYLTDDAFWERQMTLKEVRTDEGKSGSHRVHLWLVTFEMVANSPLGLGAGGYQIKSPNYVPEELFFGRKTRAAVHSSWFQSLGELGWMGPVVLIALLASCFRLTARTKNELVQQDDAHHYFQVAALEAALLSFMTASTFIDQFRSEVYYWLVMFTACAGNIFLFKTLKDNRQAS